MNLYLQYSFTCLIHPNVFVTFQSRKKCIILQDLDTYFVTILDKISGVGIINLPNYKVNKITKLEKLAENLSFIKDKLNKPSSLHLVLKVFG